MIIDYLEQVSIPALGSGLRINTSIWGPGSGRFPSLESGCFLDQELGTLYFHWAMVKNWPQPGEVGPLWSALIAVLVGFGASKRKRFQQSLTFACKSQFVFPLGLDFGSWDAYHSKPRLAPSTLCPQDSSNLSRREANSGLLPSPGGYQRMIIPVRGVE